MYSSKHVFCDILKSLPRIYKYYSPENGGVHMYVELK